MRAGRHAEAKAMLQESLALASVPNRNEDARLARQELALLALEAGDSEEARRHLETLRAAP